MFECIATSLRNLAVGLALAQAAPAHPLDWLKGTYHGVHDGTRIEEVWTAPQADRVVGSSTWIKDGNIEFREISVIERAGAGYRLEHTFVGADGSQRRLSMQGKLSGKPGAPTLTFSTTRNEEPESLTYTKDAQGNLRVTLAKKALMRFLLQPGPGAPTVPSP